MAENTIKQLEEQLKCAICLETYKNPRLLQCFHIYCSGCLEKLMVKGLTCPTCRQATPIPANGVTGLQPAFQINKLLEIFKKPKDTAANHANQEVKTLPIPPKKVIANCFEHKEKERELYCETCEDLICFKCAIKGGKHHDHDHHLLDEAFKRYKGEVVPSLEPMEGKLVAVKEALAVLDKRCGEISNQWEVIEADIRNTFEQLQETLNVRKTELIDKLHETTQKRLKNVAIQRDQMETILAQLSSCLDFVRESLTIDSQGEILMMKSSIMNQVKELTTPFQPEVQKPSEEADMKFSASQDMIVRCQNYGRVSMAGSPDPSKCQATGNGLEVAVMGEKSTVILQAINCEGEPCTRVIKSLECELVSEITGVTERGTVKHKGQNQYEISYQPTIKGKHQLHIKVEATHIRGSPFAVVVKLPLEKLGIPIQTIRGVEGPQGVAINSRGEVVVTETSKHCVSIFSLSGQKLLEFGTHGSGQGQFNTPRGLTMDSEGNILVVDQYNHRIQKFTANGQFLSSSAVDTQGEGPLKFNEPMYITFNPTNQKLYVTDNESNILVLNSDLGYFRTFMRRKFKYICGIACDSIGNVYLADYSNHCIQVFTAEGQFLRVFGERGRGRGELDRPVGIAIDMNDIVYVYDCGNECVSVFTSKGRFVTSFGEFKYLCGVAVDSSGMVYVCDAKDSCIQLY